MKYLYIPYQIVSIFRKEQNKIMYMNVFSNMKRIFKFIIVMYTSRKIIIILYII